MQIIGSDDQPLELDGIEIDTFSTLDNFFSERATESLEESFVKLAKIIKAVVRPAEHDEAREAMQWAFSDELLMRP